MSVVKQEKQRNIEERSRNDSCRWKAIIITYSECITLALVIQHAPYYNAICGLPCFTVRFAHYLVKCMIFGKGFEQKF
jgi:hypothetical protein